MGVKKVISIMEKIINKYNPKAFYIVDDNFHVDKKRTEEICRAIIAKGWNIKWEANVRANIMARTNEDLYRLMKESGCNELKIGIESGSRKMLRYINKEITLEDVHRTVAKCKRNKIMATFSFIIGFPNETFKDVKESIKLHNKIKEIDPMIEINGFFIYTPYPGTPLFKEALESGLKEPKNLEEWGSKNMFVGKMPWHNSGYYSKLETISNIIRFWYIDHRLEYKYSKKEQKLHLGKYYWIYPFVSVFFKISARIRWSLYFFSFGYSWQIFGKLVRDLN